MQLVDLEKRPPDAAADEPMETGEAMALQDALSELVRVVQFRDRDRACCYDLSVSQCYGLRAVVQDGPLSVNDLAAALVLEKSTASRLAGALVEAGLVRKVADPADARAVRLEATAGGRSIHARIARDLAAEYGSVLGDFSDSERARVVEAVRRLAGAVARRVDASGGRCCVVE
jgi:MarR family transcriptional regulator, 2-MHQ and catechol-resistance regulon repressor